jgi:hypothetical protein
MHVCTTNALWLLQEKSTDASGMEGPVFGYMKSKLALSRSVLNSWASLGKQASFIT